MLGQSTRTFERPVNGTGPRKGSLKGMIFDIQSFAIHDGPGIRTLVFMKGCPLECQWCHNPEGISRKSELLFFGSLCISSHRCITKCPENALSIGDTLGIDRSKCLGCGICEQECPTSALRLAGKMISTGGLLAEIDKYNQLYGNPDGGVTFSGGEPLLQHSFLKEALAECKSHYIHTAVETSGYSSKSVLEEILPHVDLFLYDLKLFDPDVSRKYTGVSSMPMRTNLKLISESGKDIILRFPVIPGITDTEDNVEGWAGFIKELNGIKEIDLMPYHDVEEKYVRLGKEYRMTVHNRPTTESLARIKEEFEKIGMKVKIGG